MQGRLPRGCVPESFCPAREWDGLDAIGPFDNRKNHFGTKAADDLRFLPFLFSPSESPRLNPSRRLQTLTHKLQRPVPLDDRYARTFMKRTALSFAVVVS